MGLVIVGTHTPESEFRKDYGDVVKVTQNDSLARPLPQDNIYVTWPSHSNWFWRAKYLIDKGRPVRYTHFVEGTCADAEDVIQSLPAELVSAFLAKNPPLPLRQTVARSFLNIHNPEVTHEPYAGYELGESDLLYGRGGYGRQAQYYENKNGVFDFMVSNELEPNLIYFQGPWRVAPETSIHGSNTESFEDYLALVYSATLVNPVLTPGSGESY